MPPQSNNRPYSGFFLTIEGGDGSGKSTLSRLLVNELEKQGHSVTKTREPGGTPLSESIRQVLLNPELSNEISPRSELLLYLAARAQNLQATILPALLRGDIVICERFNDSTIAYQGCARKLGMHFVESICNQIADHPDLTLLLDLDPEAGIGRVQSIRKEPIDRLEQEALQFHRDVRQGYLHLADQYPERIILLDAAQPVEAVLAAALKILEARLAKL